MTENPVLAALEAYKRTHPHREDEIEAAFESFEPDQDSEVAGVRPATPSGPESVPTSEQLLEDEVEWASDRDRQDEWWKRL